MLLPPVSGSINGISAVFHCCILHFRSRSPLLYRIAALVVFTSVCNLNTSQMFRTNPERTKEERTCFAWELFLTLRAETTPPSFLPGVEQHPDKQPQRLLFLIEIFSPSHKLHFFPSKQTQSAVDGVLVDTFLTANRLKQRRNTKTGRRLADLATSLACIGVTARDQTTDSLRRVRNAAAAAVQGRALRKRYRKSWFHRGGASRGAQHTGAVSGAKTSSR